MVPGDLCGGGGGSLPSPQWRPAWDAFSASHDPSIRYYPLLPLEQPQSEYIWMIHTVKIHRVIVPNSELTIVVTSIWNITLFIILSKIRTWDLIWKNFYVRAKFSLTLLFFEPTVGGQENWERQCPWAKLINISISIAPPHRPCQN